MLRYCMDIEQGSYSKLTTPTNGTLQMPFYIIEAGYFMAKDTYFTEREDGTGYLLFYTLRGCGRLTYAEHDYELNANTVVVIDCKRYHRYAVCPGGIWEFYWVNFDGIGAKQYCQLLKGEVLNKIENMEAKRMLKSLYSLEEYIEQRSITNDVISSNLLSDLLTRLIVNKLTKGDLITLKDKNRLDAVIEYMNQNYRNKITINELSNLAYLSKFYFIRSFKMAYGQTPYEYLTNTRITNAKKLLRSGGYSLEEIAEKTGFGDSKSLIKNFKKLTGKTPLQYKNSHPTQGI